MPISTTDFKSITIGLASPEEIRQWSHGEVRKPETINYRTYKPERDGLFCERIFGPTRDWECHCGKYKKIKFKGIICDRCGVEVTRSRVRRERMGHVELASPVAHSWYLKTSPSPIGLLLDLSRRVLEEVVYFASYIVTFVDRENLELYRDEIYQAIEHEAEATRAEADARVENLRRQYEQQLQEAAEAEAEEVEEEEQEEGFAFKWEEAAVSPRPMTPEELTAAIQREYDAAEERIQSLYRAAERLFELSPKDLIREEMEYRQLEALAEVCSERIGLNLSQYFRAGLGAEAIRELLAQLDLDELAHELRKEIEESTRARRARAVKRLKMVEAFRQSRNRPEWMILEVLPVLPPELRPMVQLDGGRFATSDLNDLYRRVINRNNRLRRIIEINAPESIVNHERRLLQEAVDALIDNSRRARPVTGSNRRPLKSLSEMLKGKEGRFRKNLLGKRVDYSGRSVIVVGPKLKMHQCGLPREMALELFKPFVMSRLVKEGKTSNIKQAKRMVDRMRPEVWDALEQVIEDHPVLLQRAPSLHRLSVQAFEPVLVDGKAIQLHPLACAAFNADFDGDTMAVFVPLSAHAQAEARLLMLASHNLFKPADGSAIAAPVRDVALGIYYMTQENPGAHGAGKMFESTEAVVTAYEHGAIDLHAPIVVRISQIYIEAQAPDGSHLELDEQLEISIRRAVADNVTDEHPVRARSFHIKITPKDLNAVAEHDEEQDLLAQLQAFVPARREQPVVYLTFEEKNKTIEQRIRYLLARAVVNGILPKGTRVTVEVRRERIQTTAGRAIFNNLLPVDMPYHNHDVAKKELADIALEMYRHYGFYRTAELLDSVKDLGFSICTRAGLTLSISDTDVESDRERIIARTQEEVERINEAARRGAITRDEREQRVLQLWIRARDEIVDSALAHVDKFNPIWMMISSGARASSTHLSQICGMRGLMQDPFGRLIEDYPVKNNLRDGLNVLEYFVSTHGARKGLADTALRTADAGYLTRRLVDVCQDVMITAEDCGTTDGIEVTAMYVHPLYCPQCGREDLYRIGKCHNCSADLPPAISDEKYETLEERVIGRVALYDVVNPETGEILVRANEEITERAAKRISEARLPSVWIRSPMTCDMRHGICAKCYGRDLAWQKPVELGTAVGIIAAQSIGEPGTQLTMRTFHTGGIAGEYITGVADVRSRRLRMAEQLALYWPGVKRVVEDLVPEREPRDQERREHLRAMTKAMEAQLPGLLRVVELFEARTPKGQAIVAEIPEGCFGTVERIRTSGLVRAVVITAEVPLAKFDAARNGRIAEDIRAADGRLIAKRGEKPRKKLKDRLEAEGFEKASFYFWHLVPLGPDLLVREGQQVRAGDPLTAGPLDPQEILEKHGIHVAQDYILREIQRVYRHTHGIDINDKHIEVILRQMFRHRKVGDEKGDTGDTRLLPGEVVDRFVLEEENRRAEELGGRPAEAKPVLMGITQASLAADGFLSAASFQRTTRVLTEAACENRVDALRGLKENVIIGRLIPAGSGAELHRDTEVGYAPEVAAKMAAAPPPRLEERDMLTQLMEQIEAAPDWDLTADLARDEGAAEEESLEEADGGFEELQDEDSGE
ncbi:MAG: DNA-directed RNA polymerase subunit beta' [Armatimonadetes bacterium]|nr:DNA-directed RNA polymerase subunit beta' [Armatimonadota bacterium]